MRSACGVGISCTCLIRCMAACGALGARMHVRVRSIRLCTAPSTPGCTRMSSPIGRPTPRTPPSPIEQLVRFIHAAWPVTCVRLDRFSEDQRQVYTPIHRSSNGIACSGHSAAACGQQPLRGCPLQTVPEAAPTLALPLRHPIGRSERGTRSLQPS